MLSSFRFFGSRQGAADIDHGQQGKDVSLNEAGEQVKIAGKNSGDAVSQNGHTGQNAQALQQAEQAQNAADQLSEEATDLCIVLNPLSISAFRDAYAAGYFGIDPFAGLTVVKCSALPAYSSADANAMYGIVGDLKAIQVNYPEGEGVNTTWDPDTFAEDDMVKVVARQYAGYGVTAPGRLVKLCKPAAATTT